MQNTKWNKLEEWKASGMLIYTLKVMHINTDKHVRVLCFDLVNFVWHFLYTSGEKNAKQNSF